LKLLVQEGDRGKLQATNRGGEEESGWVSRKSKSTPAFEMLSNQRIKVFLDPREREVRNTSSR